MYDPGTGKCGAKKGLLVLRECGEPAIGACSGCSAQICQKHQVINQQGAVLCPDCAANDQSLAPQGHVGRSRRRSYYYGHYGYPYHYGHFHDHDRHSVDSRDEVGEAGGQAGGDDFDDFDSLES